MKLLCKLTWFIVLVALYIAGCSPSKLDTAQPVLKPAPKADAEHVCYTDDAPPTSRYAVFVGPNGKPYQWTKLELTYNIDPKLPDLVRASFIECARVWRAASGGSFTFTEAPRGTKADLEVIPMVFPDRNVLATCGFYSMADNVIGHATISVNLYHFKWHKGAPYGVGPIGKAKRDADIDGVMLHEFGHALGLNHSTVKGSTLFPVLFPGAETLEIDDIKGLRSLYGDGAK